MMRIQMLVTLLLWLMVIDISDGPDHRISDRADRISLDGSPPVVPILQSQFCEPLEKCPDTKSLREYRQYCFTPPPPGHVYHCGTTQLKEIVEFFYRKLPCRKGFYGVPKKQGDGIVVSCQKCPSDRFNPEMRWSPENMDECRTHYHKNQDENAIEYLPGNNSAPAVSYCNYREGWVSANKEMFCRESYQPCNCVYRLDSCKLLELLPNDSCEPWCDSKRLPQNNFSCIKLEPPQTLRSRQTTGSIEPTPLETIKRAPPGTEESTDQISGVHITTNHLSPGQIALIIIGCIVVIISLVTVGFVIHSYKNGKSLMIAFNKTNIIHGHFNKCNRNKAVHMTKNGGRIRSEVEDLLGDDSDGNYEKSKTYNVVHLASNDNSKRETDTEDLMKGEIVKKYDTGWIANIPESLRTRRLSERDISRLAKSPGSDWEMIMHDLHLPQTEIDHSKMENQYSATNQIFSALNKWRVRNPTTATLDNYLRTCLECQKCTTIEWPLVQRIVQQLR